MDIANTTYALNNVTMNEEEIMERAQQFSIYHIGQGLHTYWLPIIIPIGLVGNCLPLMVMTRSANCSISAQQTAASPANCSNCSKSVAYMFQVFFTFGIFLIVSMTVDRFLAVKLPLQAPSLCTPKQAK